MEDRSNTMGASDMAALFGLHPYTSEYMLWAQKCGLEYAQPETEQMRLSKEIEPMMLQIWAKRNGLHVTHNRQSRTRPGLNRISATTDAHVWQDERHQQLNAVADAKLIQPHMRALWLAGLPEWYVIQLQTQMLVENVDTAYLVPLFGFGELTHSIVKADPEMQAEIIRRNDIFWKRVDGELEPPAMDEHEATTKALLLQPRSHKLVELDSQAMDDSDCIAAWSAEMKRLDAQITGAKNRILNKIGDADGGAFVDGSGYCVITVGGKKPYKKLQRYKSINTEEGEDNGNVD